MSLRSVIAMATAAAVVGVLPSQEFYAGHNKQRPEGTIRPPVVTPGEDVVPHDWINDLTNPVPIRVESYPFGENTNPASGMVVQMYVGDDDSCVQVTGGTGAENLVLYCSTERGQVEYEFGTFLLGPNCVQIPGVFDNNGVFDYPVDLARTELRNTTFHFQALEVAEPALSKGLSLRYANGNPQPELGHITPELTAILHKDGKVGGMIPILYSVLLRFEAAASYDIVVDDVASSPGTTDIWVRLKSPGGPKGNVETHRKVVDLGLFPEPNVNVWVGMDHYKPADNPLRRGGEHPVSPKVGVDTPWWEREGCRCYALGAVIQTIF